MAYGTGEYKIEFTGNAVAGEIWSNTWAVFDNVGDQDPQEAVDIIAAFYEDLFGFATPISNDTTVVRATVRSMFTGQINDAALSTITGASASNSLPTQLAVRISLSSNEVRGGPYLTGFTIDVLDAGGTLSTAFKTDLQGALETMFNSLATSGWSLAIDRPTINTFAIVDGCRLGDRMDVIRKRANDIAEAYLVVSL